MLPPGGVLPPGGMLPAGVGCFLPGGVVLPPLGGGCFLWGVLPPGGGPGGDPPGRLLLRAVRILLECILV